VKRSSVCVEDAGISAPKTPANCYSVTVLFYLFIYFCLLTFYRELRIEDPCRTILRVGFGQL